MTHLQTVLSNVAEDEEIAKDLFNNYKHTLDHLNNNYYDWIQANSPYFTDHGERHIKTVLNQASKLLKEQTDNFEDSSLNLMEIYVLLAAIVWHDVGMVQSRSGHENFPTNLSSEISETLFPNPGIQSVISRVVKAHTGDDGLEIPQTKTAVMYKHKNFEVHSRAIAALLRFADEIAEGQGRVSSASTVIEEVPEGSMIYWEFANSISGISVDHPRESIKVIFDLERSELTQRYICPDNYQERADDEGEISLIEYIVCRLEKMNNEKAYCAPEFRWYAYIREVEARFMITEEDGDTTSKRQILGEGGVRKKSGYPDIDIFNEFFRENDDLHPHSSPLCSD